MPVTKWVTWLTQFYVFRVVAIKQMLQSLNEPIVHSGRFMPENRSKCWALLCKGLCAVWHLRDSCSPRMAPCQKPLSHSIFFLWAPWYHTYACTHPTPSFLSLPELVLYCNTTVTNMQPSVVLPGPPGPQYFHMSGTSSTSGLVNCASGVRLLPLSDSDTWHCALWQYRLATEFQL